MQHSRILISIDLRRDLSTFSADSVFLVDELSDKVVAFEESSMFQSDKEFPKSEKALLISRNA